MLIFDGNSFTIDGVTVFADHEEPNRAWYLPPSGPELARRGDSNDPNFSLITYRPSEEDQENLKGGGFLMLESVLKLHDDTRNEIVSRLNALGMSNPQLSPVPMDMGRVRIIALDHEGAGGTANTGTDNGLRFIEKVLGATVPAMTGDHNALFSLDLSQEGAILVQEMFEAGAANIGVIYTYEYTGLTPDLSVIIEANYKRIYDHLSFGIDVDAGATINGLKFKIEADIDLAFEELVQNGAIKVKVIDFTGQEDRNEKEEWALKFFKEELMEEWFSPTLKLAKPAGEEGGTGSDPISQLAGAVADRVTGGGNDEEEDTPGTGTGEQGTGGQTGEQGAGGQSGEQGAGGQADEETEDSSEDDTSGEGGDDGSDDDGDEDGDEGGGLDLEAFNVTVGFKMKKIEQIEDKVVTLRYDRQSAVKRTHVPQGPLNTLAEDLSGPPFFVEVNLDAEFFRKIEVEIDNPVDYESIGLLKADIDLAYGNPARPDQIKRKGLSFTKTGPASASHAFFLDEDLTLSYRIARQYHFDAASGWEGARLRYDLPEEESFDRTMIINPAEHLGFFIFTVRPGRLDEELIRHTEVTLTYSAAGWTTDQTFIVRPDSDPQTWKVRSDDPSVDSYSYALTHHLRDGSIQAGASGTTDLTELLIDDPFEDEIKLEIIPNFDTAEISQVFVQISYSDPGHNYERDTTLTFTSETMGGQKIRWARYANGPETVEMRATSMGTDNSITRHATQVIDSTLIFTSELAV